MVPRTRPLGDVLRCWQVVSTPLSFPCIELVLELVVGRYLDGPQILHQFEICRSELLVFAGPQWCHAAISLDGAVRFLCHAGHRAARGIRGPLHVDGSAVLKAGFQDLVMVSDRRHYIDSTASQLLELGVKPLDVHEVAGDVGTTRQEDEDGMENENVHNNCVPLQGQFHLQLRHDDRQVVSNIGAVLRGACLVHAPVYADIGCISYYRTHMRMVSPCV